MELINEIHYEIVWDEEMPRDQRTIYSLLEVPEAHKKLEDYFGKKIIILQSQIRAFI